MSEESIYHVPGTAIDTICNELIGACIGALPVTSGGAVVVNVDLLRRILERCAKLKIYDEEPEHTESVNFIAWKSFPKFEGGVLPPRGALLLVRRRLAGGSFGYAMKKSDEGLDRFDEWMVLEVDYRPEEA